MLSSATKKKIDTARDMLVGKIPMPTSQVEQITLALIYKFMSDMDKKTKDLGDTSGFFANGYEKYAWDHLMDKSLPARERVLLYREALEKMALNPHIPQLFRDIFRNASLPFNDPETLKMFLEVINQFEYDHSEELGNAFEYLLQVMGSQGDAGQFRTPRHIIDFIVEVVDPKKTDKILDPACGTAGFLISAYNHLRKNGLTNEEMDQVSANFVGYDISQDMQRLSLVNMYLHHFPDPHIYEYDSLSSEERWNDDFDVILANPPFMTPKGGIRPHNRFSVPSNRAEVLFVDYIINHLRPKGRAGIIVPEGIIFQSGNAYKQLRSNLVGNGLYAVVSLPSGVFAPYSGVKTSILLFNNELTRTNNEILFVKITHDGTDLGAKKRITVANDLITAREAIKQFENGLFKESKISHVVSKQVIADSGDYNLSGDRYKISSEVQSKFELVELSALIQEKSERVKESKDIEVWSVSNKDGFIPSSEYFNKQVASLNISNYKIIRPGYFAYNPSRINVGSLAFNNSSKIGAVSPMYVTFSVKEAARLSSHYLFNLLKSEKSNEFIMQLAQGSVRQQLRINDLKIIKIPLPQISVQQEIVEELDRYQKIIDGAKQIAENYKPSFKIQEDWVRVALGKVSTLSSGGTPSKSKSSFWDGTIPWVSPKDMKVVRIGETKDHISQEAIKGSSTRMVPQGTILCVVRSGILKHSLPVAIATTEVSFNQDILAIQVDRSKLLPEFLLYYLIQNESTILQDGIKSGVTVQSFHSGFFKELLIPLPPLSTQREIVQVLNEEEQGMLTIKNLVHSYKTKIRDRIDKLWGL